VESHAAAVLGSHGRSCLREPPSPGRLPYDPVGRSSTRRNRARIVHIVPRWFCKRRHGGHWRRILRRSGGLGLRLDCELSRPNAPTQPTRSAPDRPTGLFPSVGRRTTEPEVPEYRTGPQEIRLVCRARLRRARHAPMRPEGASRPRGEPPAPAGGDGGLGASEERSARSARAPDGPPVSFDAPGGCAYKERHARSPRPGPASRRLSLAPRGRG